MLQLGGRILSKKLHLLSLLISPILIAAFTGQGGGAK
jgi:hypothetical protein